MALGIRDRLSLVNNAFSSFTKAFTSGPKFSYVPTTYGWQIPPGWNYNQYLKAYGEIGWLFGCVSRIAQSVAAAKWNLYKVTPGQEREEIDQHPLIDMMHYVNPFQTGQEFIELIQMYLDLVGEAYIVLNRNNLGKPGEMWIAPPNRMFIVPDREKFISGYIYRYATDIVPLDVDDVIQIKYPNPNDPYRGLGPTQSIAVDLSSERYSAEWNRNFFYNSAEPGGVIEFPPNFGEMTTEQYDRLKEQIQERHGGVNRAHRIMLLEGGATFKSISMTQRDMDFWRLRKMNRDVILGAYGVHPHIMGVSESVNRANAEAAEYSFATRVIVPRLVRIREKLNEQLSPMFSDNIKLDFDDPVPENRELKLREIEVGVKNSVMTINEARGMMGLDPVDNGDIFVMPMNLIPMPVKGLNGEMTLQLANGGETYRMLPANNKQNEAENTEARKETMWLSYIRKTEHQERILIDKLRDLWDDQEQEVLDLLEDAQKPTDALFDMEKANRVFEEGIYPIMREIMGDAAESAGALLNPEPAHRAAKQDYPLSGDALIWLMDRSSWLIRGINEVTRESIRTTLVDGFAEGQSAERMNRRIRSVFQDCSRRRALVIARTETIAASNEGALDGYGSSGIVSLTEFYAALDERTCEQCMGLHEKQFDLREAKGVIPVHPQCRCTWLPVVA